MYSFVCSISFRSFSRFDCARASLSNADFAHERECSLRGLRKHVITVYIFLLGGGESEISSTTLLCTGNVEEEFEHDLELPMPLSLSLSSATGLGGCTMGGGEVRAAALGDSPTDKFKGGRISVCTVSEKKKLPLYTKKNLQCSMLLFCLVVHTPFLRNTAKCLWYKCAKINNLSWSTCVRSKYKLDKYSSKSNFFFASNFPPTHVIHSLCFTTKLNRCQPTSYSVPLM